MSGHGIPAGREEERSAEPLWHSLPIADVARELASDLEQGLGSVEARRRLQRYGQNALTSAPRQTVLSILAAQFKSLIVVLLLIAAAIALLLDERVEAVAILVVLALNAVIGFLTELRAEQAITALQQQTVPTAHVVRDGSARAIPAADLVPGDVVILTAGERAPADGRILESVRLQIQEAALTGESLSVGKTADALGTAGGELALGDRANMAYLGTVVTDGRGLMMVTATGMRTEVGKIGLLIDEAVRRETPLERRLEQLGRALIGIVIAVCAVIVAAGVLRGQAVLYMLEIGISLAIAAVPEGLPAVATMTLALGVQRMARLNALVRRLPAVETLGSTTVICTDKTGTLTRNEMTVTRLVLDGADIEVTGVGYGAVGQFRIDELPIDPRVHDHLLLALRIGALCNDAVLERTATSVRVLGDPTEGALIVAAEKAGLRHQQLLTEHERLDEVPFDSATKRMVTVHRTPGGALVAFVKGSPGTILAGATSLMSRGQTQKIAESDRQNILDANQRLAAEALRVLAVAYRDLCPHYTPEDLAHGWTFVGLLGLVDPLREEAKPAIAHCRDAGIRTIMLTGDQPATAAAIARELGLDRRDGEGVYRTVHARELEGLDAEALEARLKRFFSPQLAELIVAGGAEDPLKSHRREVTVGPLALKGFHRPFDVYNVVRLKE
jgi:Ca2+-transporting ATPase